MEVIILKCPYCGCLDSEVVDTRYAPSTNTTRRRRECNSCKKRYTTYEYCSMPKSIKAAPLPQNSPATNIDEALGQMRENLEAAKKSLELIEEFKKLSEQGKSERDKS